MKSIKPGDLAEIKYIQKSRPSHLHVMQVGELREMWGGCQLGNCRRASEAILSDDITMEGAPQILANFKWQYHGLGHHYLQQSQKR